MEQVLLLNKGRLTVLGDYRLQTAAANSAGEQIWNSSSGCLQMICPDDQVVVVGDFHTYSSKSHTGSLTAGTLYVCSDFTQTTGSATNFKPSGTHAVVLSGPQPQMVTFASVNSQFNIHQRRRLFGRKKRSFMEKENSSLLITSFHILWDPIQAVY